MITTNYFGKTRTYFISCFVAPRSLIMGAHSIGSFNVPANVAWQRNLAHAHSHKSSCEAIWNSNLWLFSRKVMAFKQSCGECETYQTVRAQYNNHSCLFAPSWTRCASSQLFAERPALCLWKVRIYIPKIELNVWLVKIVTQNSQRN